MCAIPLGMYCSSQVNKASLAPGGAGLNYLFCPLQTPVTPNILSHLAWTRDGTSCSRRGRKEGSYRHRGHMLPLAGSWTPVQQASAPVFLMSGHTHQVGFVWHTNVRGCPCMPRTSSQLSPPPPDPLPPR